MSTVVDILSVQQKLENKASMGFQNKLQHIQRRIHEGESEPERVAEPKSVLCIQLSFDIARAGKIGAVLSL